VPEEYRNGIGRRARKINAISSGNDGQGQFGTPAVPAYVAGSARAELRCKSGVIRA